MRRFLRGNVGNKTISLLVDVLRVTKRFLAVLGIFGMLWSYVPWDNIHALVDEDTTTQIITDESGTDALSDYPTTTDPDFDPSQVALESEVIDERTADSKTFRKIDGTYEVAVYNDVVHYFNNGQWEQIDNSFSDLGDELENKANKFKLKFPKVLDDNKQIKLTMDDYSIDWNVLNIDSSAVIYDNTEITPSNMKELPNITSSVLYKDVQPGVDIEYVISGSQIKENIILNQYIPDFSMTFEYKLKDLSLSLITI